MAHAGSFLVPEHFDEVRTRREQAVDKTLAAVHERLVKEINFGPTVTSGCKTTWLPARMCA